MSKLAGSAVATILLLVTLNWCLVLGLHAEDGPESFREKRGTFERTPNDQSEPGTDLPRDYWVTVSGSEEGQTYQDVSIPEGFFGPGCEGFNGRVEFKGVPLDRTTTGNVDTILERSADPVRLRDPVGTVATVDLVLTELSLISRQPITVVCDDGPQTFDVHVSLSPEPAPVGWLTATKAHANGGTFDATIYLYPLLTFTNVDHPEDVYVLDTADTLDPVDLTATDIPFVHEPGDAVRSLYGDEGAASPIRGSASRQFFPGFGESADKRTDWSGGDRLPTRIPFTPGNQLPPRPAPHTAPSHAHCVEPPCVWVSAGEDWFFTPPGDIPSEESFDDVSLPAGFFGKGSDPFDARIFFMHDDGYEHPECGGDCDTFISRLESVCIPTVPGACPVSTAIRIVDVALKSKTPIQVTYNNGQTFKEFDVQARLSSEPQPQGSMSIVRDCDNGGRYDARLPFLPRLLFTEVGNPDNTFEYDFGVHGDDPLVLLGTDHPWCQEPSEVGCDLPPGNGFYPACQGCGYWSPDEVSVLRARSPDASARCLAQWETPQHAVHRACH